MSSPSPQFRFNPITGQLDLSDDHGSGPGGNIDITADEGPTISAQVFSMLGKMAGSAQVMTTLSEAGILNWENRTWETPYVVDTNATPGERGTFATIQAALDAAVIDGMTYTNPKKILIRPAANYAENLTIPGGAYFEAMGYASDVSAISPAVTITGNHQLADICLWASNGVQWTCPSGVLFTAGTTFAICQARNTNFNNAGTGLLFDFSTGTTVLDWYGCTFATGRNDFDTCILIDDLNSNGINDCRFNGVGFQINSGLLRVENCKDFGQINLNGADAFIRDTNFVGSSNDNIYGSGGATLVNCGFNNNNGTKYGCSCAAGALMINCYLWTNASVPADIISPAINNSPGWGQGGNVLKGHRYNGSGIYPMDGNGESYIGFTATTSSSGVTLKKGPHPTTGMTDVQVWVVDESGTAATNPIEVTDSTGALINGAASFFIDQNYGAALFHTDGTNWFVIASNLGGSAGSVSLEADDSNTVSGSTIPVLGASAGSAKVMETAVDTGNFLIANNTWDTAYVVDQNTTFGEKGTFATLQDAIDAIVADGVATTDLAGLIRMRPGVYVYASPVVIPANVTIAIKGDTPSGGVGGTNWQSDVLLNANVVNDVTSNLYLYNIFINADSGDGLTSPGNNLYIVDSTVSSATVGGFINVQGTYGSFVIDGGNFNAYACNQLAVQLDSGSAYFKQCGDLSIVQNSGQVIVWGATGLRASGSPGMGSSFWAYDVPISQMITVTPQFFYAGNLTANSAGLQAGGRFFDASVAVQQIQRLKGNCYVSKIVNANYAIGPNDYFIGVQGNSGAVTLTIQATGISQGCPWQSWRIADMEGTAATNPITISCNDGSINNNPTYTISSNFGAVEIYFDGTNFFITGSTSNAEFSEPIGELAYFTNKNGDAYLSGLWLKCDGSVLSQATYPVLYSRMGLINEGGINWTARTSGTTSTVNAATFGASKHLIAGFGGMLRSSTDAITWTTRTSGFSSTIRSLTFGGGNFIYGGDQGVLATSTDGITWQTKNPSIGSQTAPNQGNFGPFLAYNSGTIVGAVRDNGGLVTSTDGITWTTRDSTLGTTSTCGGVVYGGGKFVAAFFGGAITTSTDGITWVPQTTGTSSSFCGISYTNSLYIAVPNSGGTFYSSTDAVTWTARASGIGGNPANAICFGAGVYVAVGFAGNRSSTDLVTWGSITPGAVINALVYNGTIFVGGASTGAIRTSTDSVTWSAQTSQTTSTICSLIWTGSLHVYGTAGGGIGTSTDGITWVARTSGTTSTIWSLLYDGTLYHATGCNFTLSSTDAITWTTNTGYSGTTSTILSTAYGNSTYVYGTAGGRIATSPDTLVWTAQTSGTTSNVNALRYGTVFVYGTVGGGLSTSTDAVTWTARTSGTTSDINALMYGALYLYAGAGGVLASSTDAITWTARTSGTTSALNTLRYNNDFYIAAGNGGVTIQSNGAVTWYSRVSTTTSSINASSNGAGVFVESGVNGAVQSALNDYPYNRSTQFQLPTDNALLITTEAATNFFRSLYIKALN